MYTQLHVYKQTNLYKYKCASVHANPFQRVNCTVYLLFHLAYAALTCGFLKFDWRSAALLRARWHSGPLRRSTLALDLLATAQQAVGSDSAAFGAVVSH